MTVQVGGYTVPGASAPAIPSSATAVVANVTVTGATASSYLTIWPAGSQRPLASNLNFVAGETIPNRVEVPLSSTGAISVYNLSGQVNVIIDVNGYYSSTSPGLYVPISPTRICDTRASSANTPTNQCTGKTLGTAATLQVQVGGYVVPGAAAAAVPTTAIAVVANVTVTNTTAASFLTAWPAGIHQPLASDLNWVAGATVPNLVVVQLGSASSSAGAISVFNHSGAADVIVDVEGWFT